MLLIYGRNIFQYLLDYSIGWLRSREDEKLQRGITIIDDIYPAPIPNFDKYRSAIINIIKES